MKEPINQANAPGFQKVAPQELVIPEGIEHEVKRLMGQFPFRHVFAAKSPAGKWEVCAVHDLKRARRLARKGYFVMIADRGGEAGG